MKFSLKKFPIFFLVILLLSSAVYGQSISYPISRSEDNIETHFGINVNNPYKWLEDGESEETKEWVDEQNKITNTYLKALPTRAMIKKRLSSIYTDKDYYYEEKMKSGTYYERQSKIEDKIVISFKKDGAQEQVILNMNLLPQSYQLTDYGLSPDEKLFAYAISPKNNDEHILRIRNIETNQDLKLDELKGLKYAHFSISSDSLGIFYVYYPTDPKYSDSERARLADVRYHQFGTSQQDDKIVYETNKKYISNMSVATIGAWLVIDGMDDNGSARHYLVDLKSSKMVPDALRIYLHRGTGTQNTDQMSFFDNYNGYFYAIEDQWTGSEWENAIVRIQEKDRTSSNWEKIIPSDKNTEIRNFKIIGNKLFWLAKTQGKLKVFASNLDGSNVSTISIPNNGVPNSPTGRHESTFASIRYSSLVSDVKTLMVDAKTLKVVEKDETNSNSFDSKNYLVEQIDYPSKDGTSVRMYVARSSLIKLNGKLPTLMYAYGGFDLSMHPDFNSGLIPWLEQGGAYVIVQARGGGEFGPSWHEAGKLLKKQNTFNDVIAGAEYLIKNGYTNPSKLALRGESNGGLTVGAVLTQRPDLFKAGICGVPVLDMLRFNQFGGASEQWVGEYGNPDKESDFKNLLKYSPYHNVRKNVSYPAMLFVGSDSDDRVDPLHARKMVAVMQNSSLNENPILLQMAKDAGHGGGAGVSAYIDSEADVLSFLMEELGVVGK